MIFTVFAEYLPVWILLGMICTIISYIQSVIVSASICICLVILCILQRSLKVYFFTVGSLIGILALYTSIKISHYNNISYGKQRFICCIVDSQILDQNQDFKYRYTCELLGKKNKKHFLLKSNDVLSTNAAYLISANISALPKPVTPYSRDMRYMMFFKNTVALGEILEAQWIKNIDASYYANLIYKKIFQLQPNNAMLISTIFFDKQYISQDLYDIFQKAGLRYICKISGFHFAIISSLFYSFGRWVIGMIVMWLIPSAVSQHIGNICALIGCAIYAVSIDSASASAIIPTTIPIMSALYLNKIQAYHNVVLSSIISLIIAPYEIAMPSMQLSIISSLTLIFIRNKQYLASLMIITFTTTPIMLYWFGVSSIKSAVTSAICVPIFGMFIMPISILSIMLGMPSYLKYTLDFCTTCFIKLVEWFAAMPIRELNSAVNIYSVFLWCISLALYFLITSKIYSHILMFISFILFSNTSKSIVFIDRSGRNIAIYDGGIIWALDPSSFHAKQCAAITATTHILPLKHHQYFMKNPRLIYWNGIQINLTHGSRFVSAYLNSHKLVSRWQMSQKQKSCAIVLSGKKPKIVY